MSTGPSLETKLIYRAMGNARSRFLLKLAVYGPQRLGLVIGDKVVDMQKATAAYLASQGSGSRSSDEAEEVVGHTLRAFIEGGARSLKMARVVQAYARDELEVMRGERGEKIAFRMGGAKLRAPVTDSYRFKVMCIGANFADHFVGLSKNSPASIGGEKKAMTLEEARAHALGLPPWGFYKMGSSIANPGDEVPLPFKG